MARALPPDDGSSTSGGVYKADFFTGEQVERSRKERRIGTRIGKNMARNQANRINNGVFSMGGKKTSSDAYRSASAKKNNKGESAETRSTPSSSNVSQRKAEAIRNLARRGATEGERTAARAAAQRLGIEI